MVYYRYSVADPEFVQRRPGPAGGLEVAMRPLVGSGQSPDGD